MKFLGFNFSTHQTLLKNQDFLNDAGRAELERQERSPGYWVVIALITCFMIGRGYACSNVTETGKKDIYNTLTTGRV